MAVFKRNVGDPVRLRLGLHTLETDKYVIAVVKNPVGNEVAGSPFLLPHKGNGVYGEDALVFPDVTFLEAIYLVYDDAALTLISESNSPGYDYFEKEIFDPFNFIPKPNAIFAAFKQTNVQGMVRQEQGVLGAIRAEKLKAQVGGGAIYAQLSNSNIQGVIDD